MLTLQSDEEIEGERGKKREKSADKTFCARQFCCLILPHPNTILKASNSQSLTEAREATFHAKTLKI